MLIFYHFCVAYLVCIDLCALVDLAFSLTVGCCRHGLAR